LEVEAVFMETVLDRVTYIYIDIMAVEFTI